MIYSTKISQSILVRNASELSESMQLVLQYIRKGNRVEALELLNSLLEKNVEDAKLYELAGLLHLEFGDGHKGLEYFDKAIILSPVDECILNNYAHVLSKMGQLEKAMSFYQEALRCNPQYAEAYSGCGNVYLAQEQWEQAYNSYAQALALEPENPSYHNNKGVVALKLGMQQESLVDMRQACALAPNINLYKINLADTYLLGGQQEAANEILSKINDADHDDHYFTVLGKCQIWKGAFVEAVDSFTLALRLNEYNLDAYEQCALACYRMGDQNGAQYCIKQCLDIRPESLRYRYLDCLYAIPQRVESNADAIKLQNKFIYKVDKFLAWIAKKPRQLLALTNIGFVSPLYFLYGGDVSIAAIQKHFELMKILLQAENLPQSAKAEEVICIVTSKVADAEAQKLCLNDLLEYFGAEKKWALHIVSIAGQSNPMGLGFQHAEVHTIQNLDAAVAIVQALAPKVLIYADIGSHDISYAMAGFRLAPHQLQTWTTACACVGPKIDAVLAPAFFAGTDFSDLTSDQLVFYEKSLVWDRPRQEERKVAASPEKFIICAANSLKYQNEYVDILLSLLYEHKSTKAVISIDYGYSSLNLRSLLSARGAKNGIDIEDRVIFKSGSFSALLAQVASGSALVLDSFPYSDFSSAQEAIDFEIPVLCLRGPELHGQLAAQLLMACGLEKLLVMDDAQSYRNLASRLLQDELFYKDTCFRIRVGKELAKNYKCQVKNKIDCFIEGL